MKTTDDENDFASALAEFEGPGKGVKPGKGPEVGDRVSGRVVSIGLKAAFVDLGAKSEGMIDIAELRNHAGELTVAVGDTVDAAVAGTDPETGCLVLRSRVGRGQEGRAELAQAHAAGIPVEGLVSGLVKGGAEVQVAGTRAFCPISQLDLRYVEDPQLFVGQRLTFRITRFEEGRGRGPNIVLSRRVLLEEEARERAAEAVEKLKVGAVVRGTVTAIKEYGAFVDLGGVEGMLHASEISYSRNSRPHDLLTVGQPLDVQVLKIEKVTDAKGPRNRISLSLRSLAEDPWIEATRRFKEGMRLEGHVARVETYGAFVELAPGVDGLVHVSELGAGRRVKHAREAVQPGQKLVVKILGVDLEKRRIALALAPVESEDDGAVGDYSSAAPSSFGTLGDVWQGRKKNE